MAEKSIKVKTNTATVSYSVEELASSSFQLFGVPSECVVAACMLAGIKEATEQEAKKIISEFMKREV